MYQFAFCFRISPDTTSHSDDPWVVKSMVTMINAREIAVLYAETIIKQEQFEAIPVTSLFAVQLCSEAWVSVSHDLAWPGFAQPAPWPVLSVKLSYQQHEYPPPHHHCLQECLIHHWKFPFQDLQF